MLNSIKIFAQKTINLLGLRGCISPNAHQKEYKSVKLTDMPNDVSVKIASFAVVGTCPHANAILTAKNILTLKKVSRQLKGAIDDNAQFILSTAQGIQNQNTNKNCKTCKDDAKLAFIVDDKGFTEGTHDILQQDISQQDIVQQNIEIYLSQVAF